jgi:transcriptional regulator with XRE-family HTH domain
MTERREISEFLRACRERVRPEDVHLPRGPRRRTAGLRREEVASLSGLSATWYTWLEQGRPIRISEPMLAAVARALRLTADERAYLYQLALDDPHRRNGARRSDDVASLPPALIATLDAHRHPAYVKNARWDLLHANPAAKRIFGFEKAHGFNLIRWAFAPEARALFRDWRANIAREIGIFRADLAEAPPDPIARAIVVELERDQEDFRRIWKRQTVAGRRPGTKRLRHPKLGELELDFFSAKLPDRPGLTVVFFTPVENG